MTLTATWLTSRELVEAVGPWDTRLLSDDDGEYFCRVLLASQGTRFVPEARVFYRVTRSTRLSHIGDSDRKKDAMLVSMKLHLHYLRSLEDSERVRTACLTYLRTWLPIFYPERPDIVAELQELATQLLSHLEEPRLRWKYAWIKPLLGWEAAKWAQTVLPQLKASCIRLWDKTMYRLGAGRIAADLRELKWPKLPSTQETPPGASQDFGKGKVMVRDAGKQMSGGHLSKSSYETTGVDSHPRL